LVSLTRPSSSHTVTSHLSLHAALPISPSLLVPQPHQIVRPIGPDPERMVRVPPDVLGRLDPAGGRIEIALLAEVLGDAADLPLRDRKSTRLNSSHVKISYAVFCLKKKI